MKKPFFYPFSGSSEFPRLTPSMPPLNFSKISLRSSLVGLPPHALPPIQRTFFDDKKSIDLVRALIFSVCVFFTCFRYFGHNGFVAPMNGTSCFSAFFFVFQVSATLFLPKDSVCPRSGRGVKCFTYFYSPPMSDCRLFFFPPPLHEHAGLPVRWCLLQSPYPFSHTWLFPSVLPRSSERIRRLFPSSIPLPEFRPRFCCWAVNFPTPLWRPFSFSFPFPMRISSRLPCAVLFP